MVFKEVIKVAHPIIDKEKAVAYFLEAHHNLAHTNFLKVLNVGHSLEDMNHTLFDSLRIKIERLYILSFDKYTPTPFRMITTQPNLNH